MGTEKPHAECADGTFAPLLTTYDWEKEWACLQGLRKAADDPKYWDKKAAGFSKPFGRSDYTRSFLELTDIHEGESVFDMGCGTGAISIPLARNGHEVLGADFSEGMLKRMEEEAAKMGVRPIPTKLLSWEDDWEAAGIYPRSFDVAVASRSIATADLKSALDKLTSVARRKCAITLSAGSSPRSDAQILQDLGIQPFIGRDFLYAFMILIEEGFYPEVRYIISTRYDSYADKQDAFDSLRKMIDDVAYMVPKEQVDSALEKLDAWLDRNLAPNPNSGMENYHGEVEGALTLKNPRKISWAHISWAPSVIGD